MTRPAAVFIIVLALGASILVPVAGARADGQQEGPTEIEKCQTISKSGSYKLVTNLTFNSTIGGACLLITADFVTIDLAGFSISLAGVPAGSGISATPPSGSTLVGITVRHGSISGNPAVGPFTFGVNLESAFGSIVEELHVNGMGALGIGASGIVKGNTVTATANGSGISATGLVTGNYVSGNCAGIAIGEARIGGSTVIGNTVVNNSGGCLFEGVGLSVDCPSNVTDNTAVNNQVNLVLNGNGCNNTNNVAP